MQEQQPPQVSILRNEDIEDEYLDRLGIEPEQEPMAYIVREEVMDPYTRMLEVRHKVLSAEQYENYMRGKEI